FAAKYAVSLRTKKLTLIGAEGLAAFYSGLLDLYKDVLSPQVYEVNFREIKETVLEFGQYQIKSMPMSHTPQSLGYRVESGSGVVVYSGDTDVCENIIKLGKDADILILDCSFPDQMKVPGHLTPQEAGRIAHQANCRTLVLTHLYPVCQEAVLIQQAKQTFRGNIVVASDLMTIKP
ncbi:MAG: hypothetical protein JW714_02700, partial [Candidatus Omnitrophica bacterium]|nr:hypothetical protein [Candidatus Omnitrophota bacterium]